MDVCGAGCTFPTPLCVSPRIVARTAHDRHSAHNATHQRVTMPHATENSIVSLDVIAMQNLQRKPEIMSPAGYWPQLHAAIEAGADAVYFGLKHFSARAKVGFSLAELPQAMDTLHRRGVRGYITFNTLVFEHEFPEAARAIAAIAQA